MNRSFMSVMDDTVNLRSPTGNGDGRVIPSQAVGYRPESDLIPMPSQYRPLHFGGARAEIIVSDLAPDRLSAASVHSRRSC